MSDEKMMTLEDLFKHELMDLYSAEKQIIEALPKMIEKTTSSDLKKGFENHLKVTQEQKKRIKQICEELKIPMEDMTCKGMKGVIEEGVEMMKIKGDENVRDAALIIAAQRVEHYEMAGYGSAATHAKELGYSNAMELLLKTLKEEEETDEELTVIAKNQVNKEAL